MVFLIINASLQVKKCIITFKLPQLNSLLLLQVVVATKLLSTLKVSLLKMASVMVKNIQCWGEQKLDKVG